MQRKDKIIIYTVCRIQPRILAAQPVLQCKSPGIVYRGEEAGGVEAIQEFEHIYSDIPETS